MTGAPKTLIPVLGDQLSFDLSSLEDTDAASSVILMMEVADETTYVAHHRAKIAFILASKPYCSGGAYIDRMSDYCGPCRYNVKQRTGPDACPFNALYWDFLDRNAGKLRRNPRLAMPYRTWEKMAESDRQAVRDSAAAFLDSLVPYA